MEIANPREDLIPASHGGHPRRPPIDEAGTHETLHLRVESTYDMADGKGTLAPLRPPPPIGHGGVLPHHHEEMELQGQMGGTRRPGPGGLRKASLGHIEPPSVPILTASPSFTAVSLVQAYPVSQNASYKKP